MYVHMNSDKTTCHGHGGVTGVATFKITERERRRMADSFASLSAGNSKLILVSLGVIVGYFFYSSIVGFGLYQASDVDLKQMKVTKLEVSGWGARELTVNTTVVLPNFSRLSNLSAFTIEKLNLTLHKEAEEIALFELEIPKVKFAFGEPTLNLDGLLVRCNDRAEGISALAFFLKSIPNQNFELRIAGYLWSYSLIVPTWKTINYTKKMEGAELMKIFKKIPILRPQYKLKSLKIQNTKGLTFKVNCDLEIESPSLSVIPTLNFEVPSLRTRLYLGSNDFFAEISASGFNIQNGKSSLSVSIEINEKSKFGLCKLIKSIATEEFAQQDLSIQLSVTEQVDVSSFAYRVFGYGDAKFSDFNGEHVLELLRRASTENWPTPNNTDPLNTDVFDVDAGLQTNIKGILKIPITIIEALLQVDHSNLALNIQGFGINVVNESGDDIIKGQVQHLHYQDHMQNLEIGWNVDIDSLDLLNEILSSEISELSLVGQKNTLVGMLLSIFKPKLFLSMNLVKLKLTPKIELDLSILSKILMNTLAHLRFPVDDKDMANARDWAYEFDEYLKTKLWALPQETPILDLMNHRLLGLLSRLAHESLLGLPRAKINVIALAYSSKISKPKTLVEFDREFYSKR